jgi:putative FmdB family regulatory protein
MATYDYRCTECGAVQELVQSVHKELPKELKCPCGAKAEHVILRAPGVATSGMSQAPIDVVIGRDAEARWADIHRRQEIREQVRKEQGKQGLTMTGRNEFQANDKKLEFVSTPEPEAD